MKKKTNTFDILVLAIDIIAVIVVPSMLIGGHYKVMGDVMGILGIVATLMVAIGTMLYNEWSRRKQNEYQYKKEKLEKSVDKLSEVLYEQIEKINPIKALFIPITLSKPQEMVDYLLTNIMNHKALLSIPQNKIYWYYDNEQYKNSKEVKEFLDELDKIIGDIDTALSEIIKVVQDAINELSEVSKTQTLDADCKTENDVILKMNSDLDIYYKQLVQIEYERVETLYEKAKLVIKEYEEYKYERLEK